MTDNNKPDSKTLDVREKTRFTDRITLRIDPEVKKLLLSFSKQTGVTSCQIVHALLTAYFVGVGEKINLDVKSPTINLTIERVVARARRFAYEGVGVGGGPMVDKYVGRDLGVWTRVSVDEGVNPHGHAVGCECRVCMPKGYVSRL